MFVFTEMDLPRATNTSALSGAGMMRLFNKVGETVNKITYKMEENDPVSSTRHAHYCIFVNDDAHCISLCFLSQGATGNFVLHLYFNLKK